MLIVQRLRHRRFSYQVLSCVLIGLVLLSCGRGLDPDKQHVFSKNKDSIVQQIKTNPVGVIGFCDSVLLGYNKDASKLDVALAHFYKAQSHEILNNFSEAVHNYESAETLYKDLDNDISRVKVLSGAANSNIRLNNYTKASDQVHEAIKISQVLKDTLAVANSYGTLSFLSYSNKDYNQALQYMQRIVELLEGTEYKEALSAHYNNLAIIHKNMMNVDKALEINEKSLALSRASNDLDGIATSYTNIGSLYDMIFNLDSAAHYYKKSIKTYTKTQIENSIPFKSLYQTYTKMGKHDSAKVAIDNALQIEEKKSNRTELIEIYNYLLKNAIQLKQFSKSERYKVIVDSLDAKQLSHQQKERITMLERQAQLLQNKFDLEVARSEQKTIRIVIYSLSLLFLFVILFFMQLFKTTKLQHQKNKNQMELKVLRSQMNPHFIFNALSAIQNTVMEGEPIKSASYLSRFAKLIRQNFEFTSKELIPLQDDIEALKNYIETQLLRFKNKFEYVINIAQDVDTTSIYIPPMLLQPFIENAIEHGFRGLSRKGVITITITTSVDNDKLVIDITDNGKGYSPKDDGKLHATTIIKRRLKLLNKGDEESFRVLNLGAEIGTKVNFTISY